MEYIMDKHVDFLGTRSVVSLRKEINNIVNSYNSPWDILSELFQNSVDAIFRYSRVYSESIRDHKIEIEFDVSKRKLKVCDSGIGMPPDKVKEYVAPNGTDKEDESESIGEKGVGLTYTIFSCNKFTIKTCTTEGCFEGCVENASLWRKKNIDDIPQLKIVKETNEGDSERTGTEITLEDVDVYDPESDDIFNSSVELLKYIIQTKTILGYLKPVFKDSNMNLDIQLTYIDALGKRSVHSIDFHYMLPHMLLNKDGYIDFDDFVGKAATYDDKQKTQKLQKKALVRQGYITRSIRQINYYCFFAPSRNLYKEMCENNNLFIADETGNKTYFLQHGIYVATKGMPTGIVLDPPSSGFAGYWSNFYIIVEDDTIVFDLGRKTVPSRIKGTLKSVAKELFDKFVPYIKYVTSDPSVPYKSASLQQVEKNKTYTELKEKRANLKLDQISFLKNPDSQEAAVSAIFHELIGAGLLKGYRSLSTGYKQTYDLWANYCIDANLVGQNMQEYQQDGKIDIPCVIEFKYAAESIIADLGDNVKFFQDMDLLVCWDFDEQKFAKNFIEVSLIDPNDVLFYGSNYKLTWPGSYNLGAASEKPVLALRKFIEDLKQIKQ